MWRLLQCLSGVSLIAIGLAAAQADDRLSTPIVPLPPVSTKSPSTQPADDPAEMLTPKDFAWTRPQHVAAPGSLTPPNHPRIPIDIPAGSPWTIDPNALVSRTPDRETLSGAAVLGDLQQVKKLIANLKDPDQVNRHVWPNHSLLFVAVNAGQLNIAEFLLAKTKVDPNGPTPTWDPHPISLAIDRRDAKMVALLLKHGADPNRLDPHLRGRTPLHVAARRGALDMVRLLLSHNADPTRTDNRGLSAFDEARASHRDAIAQLLLDHQLDRTVFGAASQGDTARLKQLLKANPALAQSTDSIGRTPLHEAARLGWTDACIALIEAGASASASDNDGQSPLHLASQAGYPFEVTALIVARSDVNALNRQGRSPLDIARNPEVRAILKQAGARPGYAMASALVK
jgi:ankyrin repeat protein